MRGKPTFINMKKSNTRSLWLICLNLTLCFLLGVTAIAHGVAEGDKGYIQEITGVQNRACQADRRAEAFVMAGDE